MDRTGLSGPHGLATDSCWMKSMTDLRCEAAQVKSAVRGLAALLLLGWLCRALLTQIQVAHPPATDCEFTDRDICCLHPPCG